MLCLPTWLSWDNVGTWLNSAFATSLVGALAGAFAGARAAQNVAERSRDTEQLLTQVRTTNAAITASFTICNLFLALKKQHIKLLYETFVAKKAELEVFHQKRHTGQISPDQPFEFAADLRTLQMPLLPIDVLQRLVFEKLSVSGRPLALTTSLAGVCASLAELMQKRAILIEQYKQLPQGVQNKFAALYFGLPYAEGRVSTEYSDTLEAIYNHTDDGIFFSQLLCKDLIQSGEKAVAIYKQRVKKSVERISTVDFSIAHVAGLIPEESKYQDWLRGFQSSDLSTTPAKQA